MKYALIIFHTKNETLNFNYFAQSTILNGTD